MEDAVGNQAASRLVVLGASNVMWGLRPLLQVAQRRFQPPFSMMIAAGHGRAYTLESRVLGRRLPALTECGLWEAAKQDKPPHAVALLTDIGNDLVYGRDVETIIGGVEHCAERLVDLGYQLVITRPPVESVCGLSRQKFTLLRTMIFPKSRLSYDIVESSVRGLNNQIEQLARRYGAKIAEPQATWMSWDTIHLKRRHYRDAWHDYFDAVGNRDDGDELHVPTLGTIATMRLRPLQRSLFGWRQVREQPSVLLGKDVELSLF